MIGVFNIDNLLRQELSKISEISLLKSDKDFTKLSGVFIDWYPTATKTTAGKAKNLLLQSTLLEIAIKKKIPIVVFDRHMRMTRKEFKWLRRYNVYFFEPNVMTRIGFSYMPFWTRTKTMNDIELEEKERPLDLVYKGDIGKNIKSFEKYYVAYNALHPERKVFHGSIQHSSVPYKKKFSYKDSKCTVLIGSSQNYKSGYLTNALEALHCGCIPLLPTEHRFYHGLFKNVVVSNAKEIHWYISAFEHIQFGTLLDIYERIDSMFPEMKVDHTAQLIKHCLSE